MPLRLTEHPYPPSFMTLIHRQPLRFSKIQKKKKTLTLTHKHKRGRFTRELPHRQPVNLMNYIMMFGRCSVCLLRLIVLFLLQPPWGEENIRRLALHQDIYSHLSLEQYSNCSERHLLLDEGDPRLRLRRRQDGICSAHRAAARSSQTEPIAFNIP